MRIAGILRPQPALMAFGAWKTTILKMHMVFWLVFSIAVIEQPSKAETLVSSLGNTPTDVTVNISPNAPVWDASSFETGTQAWVFSSTTIDLDGSPEVCLLSDNAGQPGTPLAYLGSEIANGDSTSTFFTSQTVRLAPSTTYWIAVGNTNANGGLNLGISLSTGFAFTNVSGATMTLSASDGIGSITNPPQVWNPSVSGGAILFAIDGIPVTLSEPRLTGMQTINGACNLTISNLQCGQIIILEGSTNLISWTSLQTNITSGITLSFTNYANSGVPCQFFRASAQ